MTNQTIVLTGGGSGGHITPVLAVAAELKDLSPNAKIIYIGQRGDKLGDVPAEHTSIDTAYAVFAGKFRRYHGQGLRQLLDVKTMLFNLRDLLRVLLGIVQSIWLLHKLRPSIVFIKGGFVGVPVGLAAALLRIPYVTHDSDALPGLANRIVAPWAVAHAVALPKEVYTRYPQAKTYTVGVPISRNYTLVDESAMHAFRQDTGLTKYRYVVLVAGGGLGAQRVNHAVLAVAPELLRKYPDLALIHQAGRANEASLNQQYDAILNQDERERVFVKGYVTNMHEYSGAADVIITRAGGTNLAELAAQGKACVVVPNPYLTGGHQLVNANVLATEHAIIVAEEGGVVRDPTSLLDPVEQLLDQPVERRALGLVFSKFAQPAAAKNLAELLLQFAR